MVECIKFILGVSAPPGCATWRAIVSTPSTIQIQESPRRYFCANARLDVLIAATSLVVIPFGLPPPINRAGVYRNLKGPVDQVIDYAPIVIVPPALDIYSLPPQLLMKSGDAFYNMSRITETPNIQFKDEARYIWQSVFNELDNVLVESDLRIAQIGLHCDAIVSRLTEEKEVIFVTAFCEAYEHFSVSIEQKGVTITTNDIG